MKILAKNLEILLLKHDLVVVPGLGGFLVDYQQATYDPQEQNTMLPPARTVVFNKELKNNDGLLVHAYMQNYDANYPQAYRQLEMDVEEIYNFLNENGWVILENVGTLRMNIDGVISFEQLHDSVITPSLFALPTLQVKSVEELEKERNIIRSIEQNAELPVAANDNKAERALLTRRRWKDIAISSAAAVALFFLFAFPYMKKPDTEKIIAGTVAEQKVEVKTESVSQVVKTEKQNEEEARKYDNIPQQTVVQPQIILLQPQAASNAVVINPQDINAGNNVTSNNGDYSIVLSYAANEQCAQFVINQLEEQNLPGAFYHEQGDDKFLMYSRFNSRSDANKTLNALKKVNAKFRKAWVMKLN